MAHQTAQEGALWPNIMIRLGPHWHKVMGQYCQLLVLVAVLMLAAKKHINVITITHGN